MSLNLTNTKENLQKMLLEEIYYCIKLMGKQKTADLFPDYLNVIEEYTVKQYSNNSSR